MSRIPRVGSFHALATTPFADGINALCWERSLPGDFAEVVRLLSHRFAGGPDADRAPEENAGLITIEPSMLESLRSAPGDQLSASGTPASHATGHTSLTAAGRAAVSVLLDDWAALRSLQRDPVLNLIHGYPRDEEGGPVPTDVFSFHADSAPVPADTWLCTYHGPPSEGLRNEDAVRKIDLPATRAALLKLHGGPDDAAFAEFLSENHYDLHYAAKPGVAPSAAYSFGLFNLWRICCEYPDAPVPPCVHRAPFTRPGDPPRLLLIS